MTSPSSPVGSGSTTRAAAPPGAWAAWPTPSPASRSRGGRSTVTSVARSRSCSHGWRPLATPRRKAGRPRRMVLPRHPCAGLARRSCCGEARHRLGRAGGCRHVVAPRRPPTRTVPGSSRERSSGPQGAPRRADPIRRAATPRWPSATSTTPAADRGSRSPAPARSRRSAPATRARGPRGSTGAPASRGGRSGRARPPRGLSDGP